MAPALKRQVVLQCVEPKLNKNKYYEISIRYERVNGDPHYYVDCRWGRIENFQDGNPQQQRKLDVDTWDEAVDELGNIMFSKLKKNYKTVKDTNSGLGSYSHNLDKATVIKPKKPIKQQIQQGTFDRTEHLEVAPSDWWKSADVNIEERVV